jgi:hypothetical protein
MSGLLSRARALSIVAASALLVLFIDIHIAWDIITSIKVILACMDSF